MKEWVDAHSYFKAKVFQASVACKSSCRMAKKKVTEIAAQILEPFLENEGYELYHSEYGKEGGDWFLRIYIDRPEDEGYIGTEDCEKVSRFLSEKLDEEDPVSQNYYLEVSSPGMDRPLITRRHYDLAIGKTIEVRLYRGKDGRKNYIGMLKSVDDDGIVIEEDGGKETSLEMTEIARAKMAIML